MNKHWKASQLVISHNVMRKLADFNQHKGPELFDSYRRIVHCAAHENNASAALTIPALSDYAKAGVPAGILSGILNEVMHSGLHELAKAPEAWLIEGSSEEIVQGRAFLTEGDSFSRERRIQEILGIHERKASRFLLVNINHEVFTTNDIAKFYEETRPGGALMITVDAKILAMNVSSVCPGALFKLELK